MVKSKIFAVILVLIFAFRIWQSSGCRQFLGFHFNPLSIKITVESQTALDTQINRSIARFFHNKVSVGLFEFTKSYVSVFSPRFFLEILGPVGLILFILGITNIFRKKVLLGFMHLLIVMLIPLIVILWSNPRISFYILAISLFSLTFWGISQAAKTKSTRVLFLFLFFITFWYLLFSWQMPRVCNQIFFN